MHKITRWAIGDLKNPINWYPWLTTFVWLTLCMALLITIIFYTTYSTNLHRKKQLNYYLILLAVGIFLQSVIIFSIIHKNLSDIASAPNYISCIFIHSFFLALLYLFFSSITVLLFPNRKDAILPFLNNKVVCVILGVLLIFMTVTPMVL